MFRDLFIVAGVLLLMIAAVCGVVVANMHRMAENQKKVQQEAVVDPAADPANKTPASQPTPATIPSTDPTLAAAVAPADPQRIAIELSPANAVDLHGARRENDPPSPRGKRRGRFGNVEPDRPLEHITNLTTSSDFAKWIVEVPADGEYEISVNYACSAPEPCHFVVQIAGGEQKFQTEPTRAPRGRELIYQVLDLAKVTLTAGKTTIILRAIPEPRETSDFKLRDIRIISTFLSRDHAGR